MTASDLTLRPATLDDAAALGWFAEHVFRDTFGPHNRPEDMNAYCAKSFSLDAQQRELSDRDLHTVLAISGGDIAGYAQLRTGPAPICVTGPHPIELKRLYVDQRWHGRGIAQTLMNHAIDLAHQRGAQTLYLAVWQHNHRAIAFYAKLGFERVGVAPFRLGADLQLDPVMVRALPARASEPRETPGPSPEVEP